MPLRPRPQRFYELANHDASVTSREKEVSNEAPERLAAYTSDRRTSESTDNCAGTGGQRRSAKRTESSQPERPDIAEAHDPCCPPAISRLIVPRSELNNSTNVPVHKSAPQREQRFSVKP